MKKSIFKKVIAFALALVTAFGISTPLPALAAQTVPTTYVYVGSSVSSSAYQLSSGSYTYSPRIYTPATNERIGITLYSSSDQHILVKVYSDVTGFVHTYDLYLDDGEDLTLYTTVKTSAYFKFENASDDYAIAQYSVFSL